MSRSTISSHPTKEPATRAWSCRHTPRATKDRGVGRGARHPSSSLQQAWQAASLPLRRCSSPCRTHTRSLPVPLPGPGTYTLPRLVGPNTAYTHASPCYSIKGKSKHNSFAEDLAKVSYTSLLSRSCSPQGRRALTPAAASLHAHFPAPAAAPKKPWVPWLSYCQQQRQHPQSLAFQP